MSVVSLQQVEQDMKNAVHSPNVVANLYSSIENILHLVDCILETNGAAGWAANVKDDEGKQILTPQEQATFEKSMEPYTGLLIAFFKETDDDDIDDHLSFFPQKMKTMSGGAVGIDELYDKVISYLQYLNQQSQQFAKTSNLGIVKWESSYDDMSTGAPLDDPKPFIPLGAALTPVFPTALQVAEQMPVPARAIVFFTYLLMDTTRLMIGISPIDWPTSRKILSLVLSVIDILRGDWKKAVISFTGYFGQNYVVVGTFCKVFLDIFMLISPDLQNAILNGILDVSKSLFAGSLLFIVQTFSPAIVREQIIPVFDEIDRIIKKNNEILKEDNLPAMPSYLAPSFTHIQNLQAFVSNPDLVCSTNFRDEILPSLLGPSVDDTDETTSKFTGSKSNYIMKIILQLLRIPVTKKQLDRVCEGKSRKTFSQLTTENSMA